MNVKLTVWFLDESDGNRDEIIRAAGSVTNDRDLIIHSVDNEDPKCHRVEFTMKTMAQYTAVDLIDKSLRAYCWNKDTSTISFPKGKRT